MFSVDAGELNRRITIEKNNKSKRDSFGDEATDSWLPFCTVWAKITAAGTREFWEAQAAHAELTHKITIRYRSGITADMRVKYGERTLDIVAPPVDINEAHRYLILKCREVTT